MRNPVPTALLLLGAWLVGCDPEGPGASGKVSLGPGVDTSTFTTLAIFVFPDSKTEFDPTSPSRETSLGRRRHNRLRPTSASGPLPPLEFPVSYTLGDVLGTTPFPDWRMVAWLSREAGQVSAIAAGDVFCTVRFKIAPCGGTYQDYCGYTPGVECTLDQVAR